MFIHKENMKEKLEAIYDAQKRYLELVNDLEKNIQNFSAKNYNELAKTGACFIDLDEVIGYEKCEMVSVEHSMNYIENQCKKYGVNFSNDDRIFLFTNKSTKEDLLNFFITRQNYGMLYVEVEKTNMEIEILEFTKEVPFAKYDAYNWQNCIARQVSLEELVNKLDKICTKEISKYEEKQEENLEESLEESLER